MFGYSKLKPRLSITPTHVECPVLGCSNRVERQRGFFKQEEKYSCPEDKIYISPTTFEYFDKKSNLLWHADKDLALLQDMKDHKRECRMARDNSEDALTWNVFRYLEMANHLDEFLSKISQKPQRNAELIYWSYFDKEKAVWTSLKRAREEFGEEIRRSSEPDLIAVTAESVFFIEAKLTATNETMPSDRNNRKKYLVGGNAWHKNVFSKDYETIAIQTKKYELFRFWLLGSWIANEVGSDFFLINVVLSEKEKDIESRFGSLIRQSKKRRFIRTAWEDIRNFVADYHSEADEAKVLLDYFEEKTVGYNQNGILNRAFISRK